MRLPGILQEIADAAGLEVALKIAKAKGGTRVDFPGVKALGTRRKNWLTELVGEDAAKKVARAIGDPNGIKLDVPTARNAFLAEAIGRRLGGSDGAQRIALACGCHVRTVHRYRARLRAAEARKNRLKGKNP